MSSTKTIRTIQCVVILAMGVAVGGITSRAEGLSMLEPCPYTSCWTNWEYDPNECGISPVPDVPCSWPYICDFSWSAHYCYDTFVGSCNHDDCIECAEHGMCKP